MRAFQFSSFGLEHLELLELPEPRPIAGHVLVRVHANSLNYRDLMMVRGLYDPRLALPHVPLSDGAGEVVELGPGVTHVRGGDRVTGLFAQNWQEGPASAAKSRQALGGDAPGMLAEYVVLPEHGIVPFPSYLSYEEAATLPCAALTAWHALFEATSIQPGDTVLIQGTGGVSIFALQFAKMAGARVLGVSSSDEKLVRAQQLGLDAGLNYKQQPKWSTWVKEQTRGIGADVVVEVGGSGTLAESLKAVRVGGVIAQIGVLSGAEEKLSLTPILMRQIRVIGIYVGSRAMLGRMQQAMELHQVHPVIDQTFSFEQSQDAFRHMETGNHFGKIAITHSGKTSS